MIAASPPSSDDEGSEPWMALPLFRRKSSPDHTRNVLVWQPTAMEFDIPSLDYGFFHDYDMIDYDNLTPSHSSDSSKPHCDSAFQFNTDFSRPQSEPVFSLFQSDDPTLSSDLSRPQSESVISVPLMQLPPSCSSLLSRPHSDFAMSAFQSDTASHSSNSSRRQSEFVISAFHFDTPSHLSDSSRPPSESVISVFQSDAASLSSDLSRPPSEPVLTLFSSDATSLSPELSIPSSDSVITVFPSGASSHSPDSSGPKTESVITVFQADSNYESRVTEKPAAKRRKSLLNEISDEHIPQPVFTSPCRCTFQDCKSTTIFTTGRDFRRHYRQHFKRFFCRYEECPQSTDDSGDAGTKGFATRKDRARHEAKHNPAIKCPWQNRNGVQCTRTFSRMDNMRDHYRRIHEKESKA